MMSSQMVPVPRQIDEAGMHLCQVFPRGVLHKLHSSQTIGKDGCRFTLTYTIILCAACEHCKLTGCSILTGGGDTGVSMHAYGNTISSVANSTRVFA